MKALILAAGFGVRLREMVHGRPKPMAPIAGKPFLEYLILHLKKNGIKDVILAVGYLSDYIVSYFGDGKKWGIKISYSIDNRPLGTAGTIKYAQKYFKKDFLVLNGDTFIDMDFDKLFKFHQDKMADATIAVTRQFHGRGGLIILERDKKIKKFREIIGREKAKGYNNAGAYIFKPEILKFLKKGERASLEKDLFPLLIKKDYSLFAYPIKKYLDIGSPESYKRACKVLPEAE
jgi:NDP-sugar pyrophosphorylase family protein